MKTLQELYNEIIGSEELKAAFAEAAKGGKVAEFLKAHGCEATPEELTAFLKSQKSGELPDEELDNVAGGCDTATEAVFSVMSGVIGGAARTIVSAATGYVGQKKEDDGRLCNSD